MSEEKIMAHSGYRMTEATARELYPSMTDRNILAMIPGEEDAACPGCGARLCWGQKVGDLAKAHCVRSSDANLGIADCNWRGDIRFSFDGKTAWAIDRPVKGEYSRVQHATADGTSRSSRWRN